MPVITANQIADLLAERAPNLGEAQTMAILEELREAKVIGADTTTPRKFIVDAVDKAAAPYRTHEPVDPKVALDIAVREHLAKSLGEGWRSRYVGAELSRIYSAAEGIVKARMAGPVNREQQYLDKFQHRDELTPAERITAARLREQDEAAKAVAPAKPSTVAVGTGGDAMTRINNANRSAAIAKLSREIVDARNAAASNASSYNLRSYAENRVTVLTAKLADLGVVVT